jgi:hypothetical protein
MRVTRPQEIEAILLLDGPKRFDGTPMAIDLRSFLDDLAPKLVADNVKPVVFPIPSGVGVVVSVEELVGSLRRELADWY